MKYRTLAVLAVVGALGISGTAFAGTNNVKVDELHKVATGKTQTQKLPPKFEQGKRPEMPPMRSRDLKGTKRPPEPPKGMSRDKKPPMKDKDNRMPPPPSAHSRDKRPPEFRK